MTEAYYKLLLENLVSDVEAAQRMASRYDPDLPECYSNLNAITSTLRRAISDAKEGIRSFESERE